MDRSPRIHPTALIEPGAEIGAGTAVWDSVHVRSGAIIGSDCIIGEKTYIAYGVRIGNRVKVNGLCYFVTAVTIENGAYVGASTVFTNDRYPRATTTDLRRLRSSDPDEHTKPTLVRCGATIGASSVIGCNLEVGRFAMVGMGSVVTHSVPDFHLVLGAPAASMGYVCRCGQTLLRFERARPRAAPSLTCEACGLRYAAAEGGEVTELTPPS